MAGGWITRAPKTYLSWYVLLRGSRPAPRWASRIALGILLVILSAVVLVFVLTLVVK